MFRPSPATITRLLTARICQLRDEGALSGLEPYPGRGYTCELVFGFSPSDIAGIHTRKAGVGSGLWFRLKDGRVIDAFTRESVDPDSALYGAAAGDLGH